jgi:hypothetical protein
MTISELPNLPFWSRKQTEIMRGSILLYILSGKIFLLEIRQNIHLLPIMNL